LPSHRIRTTPIGASAAVIAALCAPASAADVADFYTGRQIHVVIGYEVGGGYDAYARLVGRHMGKHIPGSPTFIPQNMEGAGSRKAANWLYNVAPKDGSVIGVIAQTTALDQALKQLGVQFDVSKFSWIGNPIVDNQVFIAWKTSGIATLEDVKVKGGLICGGTGATTNPVIFPKIINRLIGSDIQVVAGYPGAASITLAMQRGEVNCIGAHAWSTTKATMAQHLKDRNLNLLVQWGPEKDPEISAFAQRDVPLITQYASTPVDREVLELINSSMALGRPLLMPPDVPVERVEALRRAFAETMTDPEFRDQAKAMNMDIKPMLGGDLQQLATEVAQASPAVMDRAIALTR
jgi:tripartite-type tricarboxylate transporter receptor subunit TctC